MKLKKILPMFMAVITFSLTSNIMAAVDPSISAENNPANEVFAQTLPYLPMSDPENTRDWQFSLTMSDEFEGDTLNTEKWHDHNPTWRGRYPSFFRPYNVRVEDGYLVLRSGMSDIVNGTQTYDAATIKSKLWTGYGYYEIKSRTSQISMTSSFWLHGNKFEIDVFEQIGRSKEHDKATIFPNNLHEDGPNNTKLASYPFQYDTKEDLTLDYHVYGLEYGPDFIKIYFDGDLIRVMEPKDNTFNVSMPIIFDTETFAWEGLPVAEDFYTYTDPITGEDRYTGDFHVDYVRVWKTDTPQPVEKVKERVPEYHTAHAVYGSPTNISDPIWDKASEIKSANLVMGGIERFFANLTVKAMWDENFLYLLTDVEDSDQFVNPAKLYDSDNVDLYFDFGNEKRKENYDANDFSIKLLPTGQIQEKNAPAFEYDTVQTSEDYKSFVKIPWGDVNPEIGTVIGFDAQLNEGNNKEAKRVCIAFWNSLESNLHQNMYNSGNLQLVNSIEDISKLPVPAGSNWFENGGFENPANTQLNWKISFEDYFDHEIVDDGTGNNILKITSTAHNLASYHGNQYFILTNLKPDTEYTLTFDAKKESETGKVCSVALLHYTQELLNHPKANQGIYKNISNSWTKHTITFKTDAETTEAKVMIIHNEPSTSYFDNFRLTY